MTLLELDSYDDFLNEKIDLRSKEILQFFLDKLNREIIDLKNDIWWN